MIELNDNKISTNDKNQKENENNSKIISQIVNLKLKIFFKYLISIFKKRESILKVQFFYYLKSFKEKKDISDNSYISQNEINKILISHILYHKISTSLKNIFFIYKNAKFRKKFKYFEFWKRYISLCSSLEVEINSKNSYAKKINDLDKKIKNENKKKENLKSEVEKIRQSVQDKEEQRNKSVQDKEEQRNIKQKNITNLTNMYNQLQKEKDPNKTIKNNLLNTKNDRSYLNTNTNTNTQNSIKTKESGEKIMELENNLKQMKEEELNNDRHFKNFVNNVENNLSKFEMKALGILGQKRQKSVEIQKEDYEETTENKNINKVKVKNYNINGKLIYIFLIYFLIDIKTGFNYNIDDIEDINFGSNTNKNKYKRNINTDGAL